MKEFGNFLYELRKEKRMTQAELADKLGVSNKAVSKWETGDAMPETGLLLPISRIFNVTVDELLNGKRINDENDASEIKETKDNQNLEENKKSETFKPSEHLFTRGKEEDDEENKTLLDIISGIVCGCIFLIGLATYLFLGALKGMWHPYWVIMPCCALSCGIVGIIFGFFNKEKCRKKMDKDENPYVGGICGLVMLVCIITYLLLGAIGNLWHPCWIICACGGVLCGVLGTVGNLLVYQKKKKEENKVIK